MKINLTLYEPMMHICFVRFHDIIAIWHGNVRQLEVGGSTLKVQTTWPCMSLAVKSSWLEWGRPFLLRVSIAQMF